MGFFLKIHVNFHINPVPCETNSSLPRRLREWISSRWCYSSGFLNRGWLYFVEICEKCSQINEELNNIKSNDNGHLGRRRDPCPTHCASYLRASYVCITWSVRLSCFCWLFLFVFGPSLTAWSITEKNQNKTSTEMPPPQQRSRVPFVVPVA